MGTPYLVSIKGKGEDVMTLFAGTQVTKNGYANESGFERGVIDDFLSNGIRIVPPHQKYLS